MRTAARLCICSLLVMLTAQLVTEKIAFSAITTQGNTPPYPLLTDIDVLSVQIVPSHNVADISTSFLDQLKEKVEDKLQKAKFNVFKPREGVLYKLTIGTDILIDIETLEIEETEQIVCRIQTSLIRPVTIEQPVRLTFKTEVWNSQSLMQKIPVENAISDITKITLAQIEEFCSIVKAAQSIEPQNTPSTSTPSTSKKQTTQPQPQQTSNFPFVASKNSEVFHKSTCPSAKRIAVGNIVGYKTRQEAIEAGKRPCKRCNP